MLCSLLINSVVSQTKIDRDRADLFGSVKSVETYLIEFSMKDGTVEEGRRRRWHSSTYNTEGHVLERVSYDDTGAITAKYMHTYDAKGRNTGYEEYSATLDKTLTIPRHHVYTLDDTGRRVEYIVYESNGSVGTRFVYKYDPKGNLTDEEWYPHTGQLGGRTLYIFDERGNQTTQASYNGDGVLHWKNSSKYDDEGNRTEWLQYQGNTFRYKITSSYDSKGRILENETLEFNSTPGVFTSHAPEPGKVVYTYDDEKRTKEVATYSPDGTLKGKVAYAYDERGNEIGLTMFNGDGSPKNLEIQFYDARQTGSPPRGTLSGRSLMKIEYDSHGNWTKKTRLIQSEKGGPPQAYSAELRVITYY